MEGHRLAVSAVSEFVLARFRPDFLFCVFMSMYCIGCVVCISRLQSILLKLLDLSKCEFLLSCYMDMFKLYVLFIFMYRIVYDVVCISRLQSRCAKRPIRLRLVATHGQWRGNRNCRRRKEISCPR